MFRSTGSGGRHRRTTTRIAAACAIPIALCIACAGVAQAAPGQPGVSVAPGQQPGVTQPAPAPAPPAPEDSYIAGYTPIYDYSETRTVDDYNAGRQRPSYDTTYYSEPVVYESNPAPIQGPGISDSPETVAPTPAPAPAPVPTVKRPTIVPIEVDDDSVLIGATPYRIPDGVDRVFARQVSNTFQAIQADGGNLLVDNGLATAPRADRIAAGTAAGAVTGGLVGLGVGLVPGAAITAGGAAIGAGLGVAATPVLTPAIVWAGPVGYVFVPGAAALAGAGVGAAVSAPIVAATTAVGAAAGALIGGAAAGGEAATIEEPAPAPAPAASAAPAAPTTSPVPVTPAPLATAAGPDLLAQANTAVQNAAPVVEKAVSDAGTWVAPAATAAAGFASTVVEQPAVADAVAAAGPALEQANAAWQALTTSQPV